MLTSRQRQYLLFSWFIQKDYIDLAPYIETAIREGDDLNDIKEEVEAYLEENCLPDVEAI